MASPLRWQRLLPLAAGAREPECQKAAEQWLPAEQLPGLPPCPALKDWHQPLQLQPSRHSKPPAQALAPRCLLRPAAQQFGRTAVTRF